MSRRWRTWEGTVARNALLNLLGRSVPLVVGVATMPWMVRELGTERFGVLALIWAVLGYVSAVDVGLGRATTKFVAEALGRGEEGRIPGIIWSSATVQAIVGGLGWLAIACSAPQVGRLLKVPEALSSEAVASFRILGASAPLILVSGAFRGALEAAQRFDMVNSVRAPLNASYFLLPLVGAASGMDLAGIVLLLVASQGSAVLAYYLLCSREFPFLGLPRPCGEEFGTLARFGGWATVSNFVGPLMAYIERFMIGYRVSVGAVSYYTAPYEVVTRIWAIPGSFVPVLFPAFSSLDAAGMRRELESVYARSVKYLLLTVGPIAVVLALFAGELMDFWLGEEFAERSVGVLRVLAVGVLVNSVAQVPFGFVQGLGRPDVAAKFHLLELPLYLGATWVLVSRMGIEGAALAWTLRVGLDALLLFGASWRLYRMGTRTLAENGVGRSVLALAVVAASSAAVGLGAPWKVACTCVAVALFLFVTWRYVLDDVDRRFLRAAFGR